jgi:hypothetical protein
VFGLKTLELSAGQWPWSQSGSFTTSHASTFPLMPSAPIIPSISSAMTGASELAFHAPCASHGGCAMAPHTTQQARAWPPPRSRICDIV